MKRMLIVATVLLALALPGPAAVAADDPADCDAAIAALVAARVDADAGDPNIAQLRSEQAALDETVTDAQAAVDAATEAELPALQAVLDLAVKAATDARVLLDEAVAADELLGELVVAAQVKVAALCGDEDPPAPNPADLDCDDFPLPDDERSAQQVLDETPGEDPHNLDLDGDRVACETEVDVPARQVRVSPSKAPATGTA